VIVAVALGSNLGDRRAHLDWAVAQLRLLLEDLRTSTFIDTVPVDVPDEQPAYLNGVVTGVTTLEPRPLLDRLLAIEQARGRRRLAPRAARTLDLDLILYGDLVVTDGDLEVPHPRFRERLFVLEPLADVAPHLVDPVTGLTARQLLARAAGQARQ
jgi:2-amino-4-hydroxy-6-hydroxymethyldihydropteridine diphosphokinase